MNHADTLKLLFPLEITGVFDADIALEGQQLDAAQVSAEVLLQEMFADTAYHRLADWERVCGLQIEISDTLQMRRNAVVRKLQEVGGLSRAYFIALAASNGWIITIDELQPFMCGWGRCGDPVYAESVRWIWRVNLPGQAAYLFYAGTSAAGEPLSWWLTNAKLETLLNELKPAHTYIIFNYD